MVWLAALLARSCWGRIIHAADVHRSHSADNNNCVASCVAGQRLSSAGRRTVRDQSRFAARRRGTCSRSGSAVRVKELVGDVRENGSAARGDAALGDEDEEARQELPEVGTDPGPGELRQEFGGEVERITWGLPAGSPCGAQTEMEIGRAHV